MVSGCTQTPIIVELKLDTSSLNINNDTTSSSFITATIIRDDNGDNATLCMLKFPNTFDNVYVLDADGKRTSQLQPISLKGAGRQGTTQFKVFAMKVGYSQATFNLAVELWCDNSKVLNQDKQISISIV